MPYVMYVALQGDDKLALFSMDPVTGKLALQEELPVAGGPAPLIATESTSRSGRSMRSQLPPLSELSRAPSPWVPTRTRSPW